MNNTTNDPKISCEKLARKAVVYLRQSSPGQVKHNLESQRLQYGLQDRAQQLGWRQVELIDGDLGSSASAGSKRRAGFESLIAMVALGNVGIILSSELSRLLRTDKDWCRLMEVCQLFDTLVGDHERVYDLNTLDDQLILGIKGTLSVVELKVLSMRLVRGQEAKAARGELFKMLPPGYVLDTAGKVVKDPDQRVQEAIQLVFTKYDQLWSVRQTFKWFLDNEVELPVNRPQASGKKIAWKLPAHSFIVDVLKNPFYAGAYVYGRRVTETALVNGYPVKRLGAVIPAEQARVFIRDHHLGYIDWNHYQDNQVKMRRNSINAGQETSVATIRSGCGLLAGLLRCGRCGRKLHVYYSRKTSVAPRYRCDGDFFNGGKRCDIVFGGAAVERRFEQELMRVISPLGIEASLQAVQRLASSEDERVKALGRQLQQLKYEAQRAFEQYSEVDARNRLVAAELEQRWNEKLEEVERIEVLLGEAKRVAKPLDINEKQSLLALGRRFGDVWQSDACPAQVKKKVMSMVIEEAIVTLDEASKTLKFTIHWKGGSHTQIQTPKPHFGAGYKTSIEDVELIRRMAVRYGDDVIAGVLNSLGRRTAREKRWSKHSVAYARHVCSIPGQSRTILDPDILNRTEAAKYCNVSNTTIKRLVEAKLLKFAQVAPYAPWEIRCADLDSEPVRGIVERLRKTGKLVLKGGSLEGQGSLF